MSRVRNHAQSILCALNDQIVQKFAPFSWWLLCNIAKVQLAETKLVYNLDFMAYSMLLIFLICIIIHDSSIVLLVNISKYKIINIQV